MNCMKCGDTGVLISGDKCSCGVKKTLAIPQGLDIPSQYQSIRFDKSFLNSALDRGYGEYMEQVLTKVENNTLNKNIIICSPPNSGKTVLAYTIICTMYAQGVKIPVLRDLLEIREIMYKIYDVDYDLQDSYSTAPIVLAKIPLDIPVKFPEMISTLVERRVRNSGSTIFLYGGTDHDLFNQDRFGKLKSIIGDGSYNSVEIKSWGI